jgi:heme exporter protein D
VDDANHLVFIAAAYGAGVAVVAGLIAWVMLDYRAQSAKLAEFESRGTVRGIAGRAVVHEASRDV